MILIILLSVLTVLEICFIREVTTYGKLFDIN